VNFISLLMLLCCAVFVFGCFCIGWLWDIRVELDGVADWSTLFIALALFRTVEGCLVSVLRVLVHWAHAGIIIAFYFCVSLKLPWCVVYVLSEECDDVCEIGELGVGCLSCLSVGLKSG